MGQDDRRRWDERHRAAAGSGPGAPELFLAESLPTIRAALVASGRRAPTALDLACGSGRNALLLAREGFRVVGVDVSPVALDLLRVRAAADGLDITTAEVDLEPSPGAGPLLARLGGSGFALVVVANYLTRDLFDVVPELIRPGGFLVWSTWTIDRRDGPSLRFCLERRELEGAFPALDTVCSVEREGRAAILARRPITSPGRA